MLCNTLIKNEVFSVFARGVAQPETMRLRPVTDHRFVSSEPNVTKFAENRLTTCSESYSIGTRLGLSESQSVAIEKPFLSWPFWYQRKACPFDTVDSEGIRRIMDIRGHCIPVL